MPVQGPFKCTNLVVKIDGNEVAVVEGFDIDLSWEGGVEPHYGSRTGKHAVGYKRATFTVRRMYQTTENDGSGDLDLLWDLFNLELPFTLSGELENMSGSLIANTKVVLSNCRLYRYRWRTGAAGDIVGEEGSGEAIDWSNTEI